MPSDRQTLIDEIKQALIYYRRPDQLTQQKAAAWPRVKERMAQGEPSAQAIQQVLEEACTGAADLYPEAAEMIREHYFLGHSGTAVSQKYHVSRPTVYRRFQPALDAMADRLERGNPPAGDFGQRHTGAQIAVPQWPVVGLEHFTETLIAVLRDPHGPAVVVIEGIGGLGKTTLAQLVAHQVGDLPFTGVLWASAKHVAFDHWFGIKRFLTPTPISAHDIIRQLAHQLQIPLSGDPATLQGEIRAHCQRTPYLIVLDNLETAEDTQALADLIALLAGPSRVLITSRDHTPAALPADLTRRYIPLDELDAPTSMQLLRLAATYVHAPQLTSASEDDLAQIYAVTGGNPLALWLVAGQARGMPWTLFLEQLGAHYPQGRTGYELYDYIYRRSWNLLGSDARMVLFAMHRHRAGVTYRDLFETSGVEHPHFQPALAELLERMLLQFDGDVYRIHHLTYAFLRVVIAGWWEEPAPV